MLDSVLAQTFADFELILIDDGSTDGSGAICDAYAARDRRVRVIHQANGGLGRARNVGMDQAKGKYIIFLDSDDYWLPETLETLYAEAERNRTQVLAFGAVPFWEGMEETGINPTYQHTVQNGIVKSGPESLKAAQDAREYYAQACMRLYLLEYLRATGLRFDEGIIHEDEKLSFLAWLMADRVECIGERFYQRRYRPGSIMTCRTYRDSAHGYRVAMDGLLDAYETRPLSASGREQLAKCILRMSDNVQKQFRRAIRQDRKAAAWIQKDARGTLKRMRAIPGLPFWHRLATYSLYIAWFIRKVFGTLKRLVRKILVRQ